MRKSVSALSGIIAAIFLAACGGGGGTTGGAGSNNGNGNNTTTSSSQSDSTTLGTDSSSSSATTNYAAVKPSQGDWLTYAHTYTSYPSGQSVTFHFSVTRYFNSVGADGSVAYTETTSLTGGIPVAPPVTTLDASGSILTYVIDGTQSCTFSPAFAGVATGTPGFERIAGQYSLATKWNNSSQTTCQTSSGTTGGTTNNTGSIVAQESVTVQGVTYNALKEVYSVTQTPTNTATLPTRKIDYTCWRDTVLGRTVKCSVVSNSTSAGQTVSKVEYSSTFELVGYSLHGFPAKTPTSSPYAGEWSAVFSGTSAGTCSSIQILESGQISGGCTNTSSTGIAGTVDLSGKLSLTTPSGTTYTGQLNNPIAGSGTWTDTVGGSGTWTMSHK